eukprot:TRINITY_DN2528_c0_g1_i3.p1 TRINITY_DN2528_c0_g1~~TRINITY_DN2528_c0_g1_i3.p1  ORF type:complete len:308 (+),score=70.14 TRINITY_DN2528_c0_g1_i3:360-1283(+)
MPTMTEVVQGQALPQCNKTKTLADVMSQSNGDLNLFYWKVREPATNRALHSALQALENCKMQIELVARDVNDFLVGANINHDDILAALSKAEKALQRNQNSAELCKDVEQYLAATGVVVGTAGTVVSLAASHLAVGAAIGGAAAGGGLLAVGTGGVVAVIALIGLLVYLHRAKFKKKIVLSRADAERLREANKEMLDFIAAIAVFEAAVEAIHSELSKLCRECERLRQRASAPSPDDFPGLQSALYQGERVYKDCQAFEQFLHIAIGSIEASLEDTQRYAEPAKGGVEAPEPVPKSSGCSCWGPRRS